MRTALLSVVLSFCAPIAAQNLLFAESFANGIPANWTQLQLGFGPDVWLSGVNSTTGSGDAYHEYFCTNGTLFRDNRLVSPPLDLRGLQDATLTFLDWQVLPTWRFRNAVEASVAGGPWTTLFTVTRTTSGPATVTVSLAPVLDQPNVRLAFHYQGDIANEWRVDDVRVTTSQPVHTVTGLAAGGVATLRARGALPGSLVLFAVSLVGPGPIPTASGTVFLTPPFDPLLFQFVDAAGAADALQPVPPGTSGATAWSQCFVLQPDLTLVLSNALTLVVP